MRFVYGIGRHQFLKHTSQSLEQLVFVCYELFTLDYIIELLKPHCLRRQSTADTQTPTCRSRQGTCPVFLSTLRLRLSRFLASHSKKEATSVGLIAKCHEGVNQQSSDPIYHELQLVANVSTRAKLRGRAACIWQLWRDNILPRRSRFFTPSSGGHHAPVTQ